MNKEIQRCIGVLTRGGTILYPTDTIWGIGCDATNPDAVKKIYKIKKRVASRSMIVLVDSIDMVSAYVEEIPPMALEILKLRTESPESGSADQVPRIKSPGSSSPDQVRGGPGRAGAGQVHDDKPLTIVYPGAYNLAGNLVANDGSIGIRITTEPFCRELIKAFGKPLVSSSANLTGQSPPACFSAISGEIRSAVDYVANWRRKDLKKRNPSGILKVHLNGEIEVIRQ